MPPDTDKIPVRESIRQIHTDSWILGCSILLTRTDTLPTVSSSLACWSDGKGGFFVVSDLGGSQNIPLTSAKSISEVGVVKLVHESGDSNAAWRIGEAFCKVQDRSFRPDTTREHATLAYINHRDGTRLTFSIPQLIYHAEFNNRYYLIVSRLPGETLEKAWPSMTETSKKACVDRVIAICKELNLKGGFSDTICGVDQRYLDDRWLIPGPGKIKDHSPASFTKHCVELGMDCSDLVFHHCDLGPGNIIVEFKDSDEITLGIIDWEMAGYVPRDWVRTKFRVCWAMDFDFPGENVELSKDWRERVQVALGQEGYREVGEAWKARWKQAYDRWDPE